jgi:AraC-like DNA-binding protein
MDRLAALLQHFSLSARLFHSGPLCGIHDFAPEPGLGQLHLVRAGRIVARHHGAAPDLEADGPCLLFYPRPMAHRFECDAVAGPDMACAHVRFGDGPGSPLAEALPAVVALPLDQVSGAAPVLEVLFAEAFGARCGRQAVVDRLFEAVLVMVLRELMTRGRVDAGLLAGLADPKLARALVAIHEAPAADWSLAALAAQAGLSRSLFAASFREVVGITAGDYLARWRIGLAQHWLRQGRPLKWIAGEVGYAGEAALSRAFKARCGMAVREWRRAAGAG